jgi:FolB domain-containing protein
MAVPDRIVIKDLLLRGIVGINDWERKKRQDILINLVLETDLRRSAKSDDVDDTLNYRTLTKRVVEYVESAETFLVEALAERIAAICVLDFGADRATVRVEKPGALRFASSVGVEVTRQRKDFDDE